MYVLQIGKASGNTAPIGLITKVEPLQSCQYTTRRIPRPLTYVESSCVLMKQSSINPLSNGLIPSPFALHVNILTHLISLESMIKHTNKPNNINKTNLLGSQDYNRGQASMSDVLSWLL